MNEFIAILWAFLALFLCLNTKAQDIIYTISGEINSQKASLDSIAVENLTSQTHIGFGDLPERDDYRINLSRDEYWGSTSVSGILNTGGLYLVKNLPGSLAVGYKGQTVVNAAIDLYNTKGQCLTYKENQELENGSLIEAEIGTAGIYFLTISTPHESRTFKATGILTGGSMSIATQSGTAVPLKSGNVYTLSDTNTEKGDNVRVSVFKDGYVAQPVEHTVDDNENLVFQLKTDSLNWARDNHTRVIDVTNPVTGQTWMDRNLGASRAATNITDEEAYGDLFQWGRAADGHQKRNSETTSNLSDSDQPGHGKFINTYDQSSDWRRPQNHNLWQGENGTNNPCPIGYRLPTLDEWKAEMQSWISFEDADPFASPLKLPLAGYRCDVFGTLIYDGIAGNYWSSSIDEYNSWCISFGYSGKNNSFEDYRAIGYSVRCIKETETPIGMLWVTSNAVSEITATSAKLNGNVTYESGSSIWERGFYWSSTNNSPGPNGNREPVSGTIGAFSTSISSLQPNTTYFVRAYATRNMGTVYGNTVHFITEEAISTPVLTTASIISITQTTAVGGGNIISHGGATVTAHGICWNTTGNPTTADNKTNNGNGTGSFTSNLSGLQPGSTYYVRAYATNSIGTSYGRVVQFTTSTGSGGDGESDTETIIADVTNPATGRVWMDRNLGASRAAMSSTDEEAYGDLYQWGRAADGHQNRNSLTTSALSNSDTPGHRNFILASDSPHDWRSPQNHTFWQGVSGVNNPCPSGYRLPTITEWDAERLSWSTSNADGAFSSPLKLPLAGYRHNIYGSIDFVGSYGYYWSSTINGFFSMGLNITINNVNTINYSRTFGQTVRCIKD